MARDSKKQDTSATRGGKKSSRRSAATIANKARKMETRISRLLKAAERRTKISWTDPSTGRETHSAGRMRPITARRENSAASIVRKATVRDRFKSLGWEEKKARRENGERQFGSNAPEYHRLKISPAELELLKKKRPQKTEPFAALKG